MSEKSLLNSVKIYNDSVKKIYDNASRTESKVLDITHKAMISEAFSENFEGKKPEDYSEFEKETLKMMNSLLMLSSDSNLVELYKDSLSNYTTILKKLQD
ncbi:hypothetical protein AB6C61_10455 [Vibrio splendidus]